MCVLLVNSMQNFICLPELAVACLQSLQSVSPTKKKQIIIIINKNYQLLAFGAIGNKKENEDMMQLKIYW